MSQLRRSVSGALSRRALKDAGPPQEVLPQGDPRIDMLTNAVVRLERREDFAREIGALWKRAQATFLTIGQYLNQAKDRLPHGEFNAMIERDLPFGSKTAHQIRAASAAVQSGRLPAAQLPPNYTTLYYLSTLPDAALEQARRDGLLRPDLRRAEVVAFKARFQRVIEGEPDPVALRARRLVELRRQRAAIDEEIVRLEAEAETG